MAKPPKEAELVVADHASSPGLPSDIKDQAKALYLKRTSAADISRTLGITERQLARWRTDEDWALEREVEERGLLEDGFGGRRLTVSKLATLSTELIDRGMQHLKKRVEPPSITEMVNLSTIAGNLDKLLRLETGKATENIAIQARMTAEEIRKTIVEDPFFVLERKDEAD
jgi:hypothetical protein